MAIRKCTESEAIKAAQEYGVSSIHKLKEHVVGKFVSVSTSDIFIEGSTGEIYVGNKDGSNLQSTGIRI